ncbi:MAG: hypothetical protein JWN28_384 [Candidatus Saccharibacteria bacterium]|nr:hypothetical protein [Candidatus Saccharibacteria bacterium]
MSERFRNPPEKPATPPLIETFDNDVNESGLDKKYRDKERYQLLKPFFLKLGAVTLAAATIINAYWADVEDNRAKQAAAVISINDMSEPMENDVDDISDLPVEDDHKKATFFIDGFNSFDADYYRKKIGPGFRQVAYGEEMSLSLNNAFLSREGIYKSIERLVKANDYESVSIAAYSMGGDIAIEAASDLVTKTDIEVDTVTTMSTPDGFKGLRKYQQKELSAGLAIANIPGAVDSSWVRNGSEMYFYRDKFTKGEMKDWWNVAHNSGVVIDNIWNLIETWNEVVERSKDPKRTSMQLLTQQVYKMDQFDMLKELKAISAQRGGKQMPVFVYLGTGSPGYDYMVDDKLSSSNFARYAHETDLDYLSYLVPGAIHSQYYKTIDEYNEVLKRASPTIRSNVDAEIAAHHFALLAKQKQSESLAPNKVEGEKYRIFDVVQK